MDLTQVSIVILSQGNNPRILNPDFLARNGIVPSTWEPATVTVLPPIAVVRYENGGQVTLEGEKVQFIANSPEVFNWADDLPRMAVGFISTLHHVNYGSVGLNFSATVRPEGKGNIQDILTYGLLKEGEWSRYEGDAKLNEIKLQYEIAGSLVTLTTNFDNVEVNGISMKIANFSVNFHREFAENDDVERRDYINSLSEKYDILCKLVSAILMVGE